MDEFHDNDWKTDSSTSIDDENKSTALNAIVAINDNS